MRYSLHPAAEEDLRQAAMYYQERAGNTLSQSLLTEFEHSINILLEHPRLGAFWRHDKRRYVMKHFPYSLIYTISDKEIRIWAAAHQSRHPGYWSKRK
jgi:plasmid stabilization system protein ParE